MSGGLCKIHGTPFNGFGTLVFCNECDAENDIQNEYESDKDSSEEIMHLDDEKDCVTSEPYGYVVFGHQQKCRQRGTITLPVGKVISTREPAHGSYGSYIGACYRFRLASVSKNQTNRYEYRVMKEISLNAEQVLYHPDGYIYIGGIKTTSWSVP